MDDNVAAFDKTIAEAETASKKTTTVFNRAIVQAETVRIKAIAGAEAVYNKTKAEAETVCKQALAIIIRFVMRLCLFIAWLFLVKLKRTKKSKHALRVGL